MTYKKTWFSYLLWAAYTCATGVMLADYAILFWQKKINAAIGYGTIVFVFLVFAGAAGCYFLMRKTLSKRRISGRTAILWEIFIALSIFFVALLYRVYLYMQGNMDMVHLTEYYRQAAVKAEESAEPMVHAASYLYTLCLSFLFSFLGNKVAVAVWMQIVVQMITILLAFFTVRKLVGSIPACMTMLVLSVSSVYTSQIFAITPECFLFIFYLAGLAIVGNYVKTFCRGSLSAVTAVSGAVLSGISIGVLTYLDAVSITIVILLIGLFTGVRGKGKKKAPSGKASLALFILIIIAGGLALMGMFALDAYSSRMETGQVAQEWLTLYQKHLGADYVFYQTGASLIECFILVAFAAFLIMSFWNRKKVQNATPWICLMFLLAPTPLTTVGVLSYQVYAIFFWSILAGIGLQQSLLWEVGFVPGPEPEITDEMKKEEQTEAGKKVEITEDAASGPVGHPRFLENPLPLPKKHEKKEMDYQYEIAADKMKFDIEIKENDDFDI